MLSDGHHFLAPTSSCECQAQRQSEVVSDLPNPVHVNFQTECVISPPQLQIADQWCVGCEERLEHLI